MLTLPRLERSLTRGMVRQAGGDICRKVARWCSGWGAGLVIERSQVRLPTGALPGSLGQLSLPSLRGR